MSLLDSTRIIGEDVARPQFMWSVPAAVKAARAEKPKRWPRGLVVLGVVAVGVAWAWGWVSFGGMR